jgi:hypothetical protein
VYTLGQQLLWGLLGSASVAFAVVFDGRGQTEARQWAAGVAGTCALFLVGALWRGRRLLKKRP